MPAAQLTIDTIVTDVEEAQIEEISLYTQLITFLKSLVCCC